MRNLNADLPVVGREGRSSNLAAAADDQDLMGPVEFGQVAKSAGQGFDAFDVLPLFAKRQGWNLTPGGSPNKKLFG